MRFDAVEDVCGVFLIVRLDMLVHLAQHLLHGDITIHQEADSGAGAFAEHAPQEEIIRDLTTAQLLGMLGSELEGRTKVFGIVIL